MWWIIWSAQSRLPIPVSTIYKVKCCNCERHFTQDHLVKLACHLDSLDDAAHGHAQGRPALPQLGGEDALSLGRVSILKGVHDDVKTLQGKRFLLQEWDPDNLHSLELVSGETRKDGVEAFDHALNIDHVCYLFSVKRIFPVLLVTENLNSSSLLNRSLLDLFDKLFLLRQKSLNVSSNDQGHLELVHLLDLAPDVEVAVGVGLVPGRHWLTVDIGYGLLAGVEPNQGVIRDFLNDLFTEI